MKLPNEQREYLLRHGVTKEQIERIERGDITATDALMRAKQKDARIGWRIPAFEPAEQPTKSSDGQSLRDLILGAVESKQKSQPEPQERMFWQEWTDPAPEVKATKDTKPSTLADMVRAKLASGDVRKASAADVSEVSSQFDLWIKGKA